MVNFTRQVSGSEILKAINGKYLCGPLEDSKVAGAAPLSSFSGDAVTYCGSKNANQVLQLASKGLAGIAIVPSSVSLEFSEMHNSKLLLISADDSRLAFIRVLRNFAPRPEDVLPKETFIHPTAVIHPKAKIGSEVYVGPYCVVGESTLGDRTRLHAFVSVRDRVAIGADCKIAEHTVIGKDGFGYQEDEDGQWILFPHSGGVVIEDDVHIGSSTTVDQGVLSPTRIGRGSRIDNLVHIAHNVQIGSHNMVIACAEVSGSVITGPRCWIGPNSSILNGVSLGSDVFVGIRALVVENVSDKFRVTPTRDNIKQSRS